MKTSLIAILNRIITPGSLPERMALIVGYLTLIPLAPLDVFVGAHTQFIVAYLVPIGLIALHGSKTKYVIGAMILSIVLQVLVLWLFDDMSDESRSWNFLTVVLSNAAMVAIARFTRHSMLEANRLSNTDPLTELNNRRSMENVINAECVRQRRYGGCFSVVVLDLDGFKGLNDTKGHHVGDQALIRAAMLLRTRTRKADTVARFGGDEFAIVMPNTDAASGEVLCQHVCRDMGVTLTEEFSMPLSASIGVVTVEKPDMRVEDILASADKAMYRAKESGKGCVVQGELVRVSDDGEEMALEARP